MVSTEHAPRRQQFHIASAIEQVNSTVTTSVDIQNTLCNCKATVTPSELRTTRAQWVCSEAKNSAVVAIVKLSELNFR